MISSFILLTYPLLMILVSSHLILFNPVIETALVTKLGINQTTYYSLKISGLVKYLICFYS